MQQMMKEKWEEILLGMSHRLQLVLTQERQKNLVENVPATVPHNCKEQPTGKM